MRTDSWTEPLTIGAIGGAWIFPEQSIIYTESRGEAATAADVDALFDFYLWMEAHFPVHGAATIIHDWRSLRSVPPETRKAFIRRRKEITQRPARVVIAMKINPLLRMTVQTVAMAAQLLVHAVDLSLVEDPHPPLRELGASEPDPTLHARLRLAWRHACNVTAAHR